MGRIIFIFNDFYSIMNFCEVGVPILNYANFTIQSKLIIPATEREFYDRDHSM